MKKLLLFVLPLAIAGVLLPWLFEHRSPFVAGFAAGEGSSAQTGAAESSKGACAPAFEPRPAPRAASLPRSATSAERIKKVNEDYDQLTLAVLGGLGAGVDGKAGPSDTMLRELALLERERRRDVAALMDPREFEDRELKETPAGQLVSRAFEGTTVPEEQRREVFRLQRDLDLRLKQTIDSTARSFLEGEQQRQRVQENIRGVLGEDLFKVWRATSDDLYAKALQLAKASGAGAEMADALARARDEYNLQVLTLRAAPDLDAGQRHVAASRIAAQTRAQAAEILGKTLYQTDGASLLTWLPTD